MKNLILASSSSVHGSEFLEYLKPDLLQFFNQTKELLFFPYARPSGVSYDAYTELVAKFFMPLGIKVRGIHKASNACKAISNASAIFIGGGNTFVLVAKLYEMGLMDELKKVISNGTPYLGTSAGSNICGVSMNTTNDMPIVMPDSFETLGIIPYNINAHFIESDKNSTHRGETRETRIKEYHEFHHYPVIGLKEGSWLRVTSDKIILKGGLKAFLFQKDKDVLSCDTNTIF